LSQALPKRQYVLRRADSPQSLAAHVHRGTLW
jgi:hypothetical protein